MKEPRLKLAKYISDQTISGHDLKSISRKIAAYLLETGRTDEASSLLRDIQQLWADKGKVDVFATSAHELSNADLDDIKKLVKSKYKDAKDINVIRQYDETVIGGVRVEFAGYQIDLSIRNKLDRFRQLVETGRN